MAPLIWLFMQFPWESSVFVVLYDHSQRAVFACIDWVITPEIREPLSL